MIWLWYFGIRWWKKQESGENCMKDKFVICTPHETVLTNLTKHWHKWLSNTLQHILSCEVNTYPFLSYATKFRIFVTQISLPCSWQPFSCPYFEPDNWVHVLNYYFFKVYFNIIFPSMFRSFELSHSFTFPHPKTLCNSLLTYTCHMPHPSHPR